MKKQVLYIFGFKERKRRKYILLMQMKIMRKYRYHIMAHGS